MKKIFLLLFALTMFACNKDKNCDNGQLTIKNSTGDTVFYSWGSSSYTDTLLPGASVIYNVGEIENTITSQTSYTVPFYSDHGDYAIEVNSCHQERELQ